MWSQEIPTETGLYWFYGDPHSNTLKPIDSKFVKIYIVEIKPISNGVMYTCYGHFIWPAKIHPGWWMKLEAPSPPDINNADTI